jgi:salicylate hydroxylase
MLSMILEKTEGDFQVAFEQFNQKRAARTARVQMSARLVGEHIYHPSGIRAQVRTSGMLSLSTQEFYEQLAWLYDNKYLTA